MSAATTRSGFDRFAALHVSAARPTTRYGVVLRMAQWSAIAAGTGGASYSVADWRRIAGGLCVLVAGAAFQWTTDDRQRVRTVSVSAAIVFGLAGILLCPGGFAEIPVAVAAGRLPTAFERHVLPWVTGFVAVVFAVEIGWVAHSWTGVLSGMAIPFIVQRALANHEIVIARDRAQALLVEVQNGREAEAQAAALQERGRIARDLHDVLAHSLAGLSLQLQAVRAVAAREHVSPNVLEPLDTAAQLARDGLAEARSVVSALRDPVGLGIAELPALIQRHPGNVRFAEISAAPTVSAAAGHAVYRAVQEALTNSARYAPGAAVTVTIGGDATTLRVEVADTGLPPGRSAVTGQGTGLGLAGMDERVRSVGGSLQAGPAADGGWRVTIEVPAEAAP